MTTTGTLSVLLLIPIVATAADEIPEAVRKQALAATIRLVNRQEKEPLAGSGVVIGRRDGFAYALTAKHVIQKKRGILTALWRNGENIETFPQVEVVAETADSDLALVRFPTGDSTLPTLKLAPRSPELKKYPLPVLNVGFENEEGPTATEDVALDRKLVKNAAGESAFYWQTKSTSSQGRSGGALLNAKGELIGICSGNQQERGYFTHRDEIQFFLRQRASSPWLTAESDKP